MTISVSDRRPNRDGTRRRSRGQALVEFAIVLPIALLLLTATIDVGRIIFTYIALEDAVQEGSIYLAHHPKSTQATIQARVRGSSDATEVAGATVTIQACATAVGDPLWVEAQAPAMSMITPLGNQLFGGIVLRSRINATNLKGACS